MHINKFLDYLKFEKNYSLHTIKNYAVDLNGFQLFLDEVYGVSFLEVQSSHVRSFLVSLSEKKMAVSTINRKLTALRVFYKFLLKVGELEQNPTQGVLGLKKDKSVYTVFSKDEVLKLFSSELFSSDFSGQRDSLVLLLLLSTGIRRQELIDISEASFINGARGLKVLGKRKKERIIPLPDFVIPKIKDYRELKSEAGFSCLFSSPFFVTDKGSKLYPKFVYNLVSRYLSLVSIKQKKNPHTLRHTFATQLLNNGADLNDIKELLGHSSLSSTQVYTHHNIQELKKTINFSHPKSSDRA